MKKTPNVKIEVKVLNTEKSIAKEVVFGSTKTIKEVLTSNSVVNSIHMTEGMRVIKHMDYSHFVFLFSSKGMVVVEGAIIKSWLFSLLLISIV